MGLASAKVNLDNIKKIDQDRLIDLIGDFKALSYSLKYDTEEKALNIYRQLALICKDKYKDLFIANFSLKDRS